MVEENVFRLQIPINNTLLVESLKSEDNFSSVEADSLLRELLFSAKMVEEFPSIQKVHDHVQLVLSLESVVHGHEEGAINFLKNLTLRLRMVDLVSLQNALFSQDFHRVKLA